VLREFNSKANELSKEALALLVVSFGILELVEGVEQELIDFHF